MIELKLVLTSILIGWFIVNYPIFKWIINTFKDYGIYKYINQIFSCIKCASFYVGLFLCFYYDQNIIIAIAASFVADVYDRNFNIIRI
jgi:hypothetical protein